MVDKTITATELIKLLERVEYLDITEIHEFGQNALRLVVNELSLNTASAMRLPPPLDDAVPVEHQSDDLCFEIAWDRYDVYQVLNESYDSGNGPEELWEGNLFRRYSESRYLRFIGDAFENIGFLDPERRHWSIVGQNHIVHVISGLEPSIRILNGKR